MVVTGLDLKSYCGNRFIDFVIGTGNLEDGVRHRGGGMGRSSDGTFDTGVTSAYSSSGRTETFGANAFDPRRTSRRDDTYTTTPSNYYDSYWNRPYSNNQRSWRSTQAEPRNSGYGFFIVFAFFAFFCKSLLLSHEVRLVLVSCGAYG